MDKKFNFKLDKDKIKLQLKDLGKKFVRKKGSFRNGTLIFIFFVLIGVGFAIYNREQDNNYNNLSSNQLNNENQNIEIEYGREQPSFYPGQETENNFSLNYPRINENENNGENKDLDREIDREIDEQVEGVVTEPVRPIDQIQHEESFLELLKPFSGNILQNSGWYYHPVFDDWRYQQGLEFSGNTGDVVMAAAGGQVSRVLEDDYKGIMVLIEHENGWVTEYGHLQRAVVSPGEKVSRGQEIGRIGVTGVTSQPSLYFSLKNQDGAIDPAAYFQ